MLIKQSIIFLIIIFLCSLAKAENKCEELPSQIFGLTTESAEIDDLPPLINALQKMKDAGMPTPTVRIVFQSETPVEKYEDAVKKLHGKKENECQDRLAFVMGLLVDSSAMHEYNSDFRHKNKNIESRAKEFSKILGDWVDIWEVGNELNGQWVGWENDKDFQDRNPVQLDEMRKKIGKQIIAVYNILKKHPKVVQNKAKLALNLYLFDNEKGTTCRFPFNKCDKSCSDKYEMIEWTKTYLSPRLNQLEFDYIFFSFYQDDCQQVEPTTETLIYFFEKLTTAFTFGNKIPKVGLGEVGKQCKCPRQNDTDDDRCDCPKGLGINCQTLQVNYIKEYYQDIHGKIRSYLKNHPEKRLDYVGGFFYWTFYQDATPDDDIAKDVLNSFIDAAKTWK